MPALETEQLSLKTGWSRAFSQRLFIFGFRCMLNGSRREDQTHWTLVWQSYRSLLGHDRAAPVLEGLWELVTAYRACSLRQECQGCIACPHLTRDEFLILALVSASQHDDSDCISRCLRDLAGISRHPRLEHVSWRVGADFLGVNQRFLPISSSSVDLELRGLEERRQMGDEQTH